MDRYVMYMYSMRNHDKDPTPNPLSSPRDNLHFQKHFWEVMASSLKSQADTLHERI